ncbi:hypothetical protein B7486_50700 [cyanobacterium TDX16]|nr:hypothetical protein B7486_50700 [cyanobacterium TDX16]
MRVPVSPRPTNSKRTLEKANIPAQIEENKILQVIEQEMGLRIKSDRVKPWVELENKKLRFAKS